MTIFDMLGQSGVLALLGMGTVFGFLVIMVISISTAGKIIGKFVKEEPVKPVVTSQMQKNDAVSAAISGAVNEYRKNK